ncbi:pathogenesis-related protein 5 [Phtheirospermum japonicum]|uniref:Pathogenesis-related protein 5 n=1 Tax=Phtheirospermum japonicum TaxID=374723 RepID=A0A830C5D3_9LAMI|nr:pathogenesis-related protein 5 [Phtheirospermum japonicum]
MSDREESPDWLRSFQPETQSTIELSSESELPSDHSPLSDDEDDINLSKLFKKEAKQVSDIDDKDDVRESEAIKKPVKGKSPKKNDKVKRTPEKKKRKNDDDSEREGKRTKGKDAPEKRGKPHKHSIWSLSSDSESSQDARPVKKDKDTKGETPANKEIVTENKKESDDTLPDPVRKSPKTQGSKVKSAMKQLEKVDERTSKTENINSTINEENDTKDDVLKEENDGKHPRPQGSSSKVPLLLSEKVQRSKALVECEGDSIDLSGDVGTIYKTTIVPSRTFCVVSFGQSEAKIEAIMNDYIQLKPVSNVYEAETMVEGTLDGFSFDSEDEADKAIDQADQHEDDEEQLDRKTKAKSGKPSGPARKKGKPAGGKPAKKVKKKPQVSKKSKTKK